jgi:hypothetical protein
MPRHTYPSLRAKHPRAHTIHQRGRYISRRWHELKNRERYHWDRTTVFFHPEEVAEANLRRWSMWEVARRGRSNLLNRNPWNRCSCWVCQNDGDPSRTQERRADRREIDDGYVEWSDGA